jgi:hypothetical protein
LLPGSDVISIRAGIQAPMGALPRPRGEIIKRHLTVPGCWRRAPSSTAFLDRRPPTWSWRWPRPRIPSRPASCWRRCAKPPADPEVEKVWSERSRAFRGTTAGVRSGVPEARRPRG